jgi:precorrin-6B C5,15-methyltransferase / cobalt-precorrin-6B C5,C15-methyltransferase
VFKIFVIGVDSFGLRPQHLEMLISCQLVIGSDRQLAFLGDLKVDKKGVTPLAEALAAIRESLKTGNVGVLASGDSLFYGIGKRLLNEFSSSEILFQPALSSMQEAFARFKIPWDDATIISLHGRRCDHPAGRLLTHEKSFVFTDSVNSPNYLAEKCLEYCDQIGEHKLLDECRVLVAEQIGSPNERLIEGRFSEVAEMSFDPLNVMCVLTPGKKALTCFGLLEGEICHSRGLITKNEVRAATLHTLRLPKTGVLWDVGAGSGSISLEASRMNPELTVFSLERKEEELVNIKKNIRRYRSYNVVPVVGEASVTCRGLPDPDVVFIGGSGGSLKNIIKEVAQRLPKGGRLVVNGVIEKTRKEAPKFMAENGLLVQSSTVSVSRIGENAEEVVFNPITIMVGQK